MGKKQNQAEYKRCKERGLIHRLSLSILKEFGTKEEIAAREDAGKEKESIPSIPSIPKPKPKKKKGRK